MSIHDTIINHTWKLQTWDHSIADWEKYDTLSLIDSLNKEAKPKHTSTGKNIITTLGLTEMAKRGLPTGTKTTNSHFGVGIGTRLENLADTDLQTQVGNRKAITSATQFGTSARFASFFSYSNVGSQVRQIAEAGIFTAATAGILISRYTTENPAEINSTDTLTLSVTITHENGTTIPE